MINVKQALDVLDWITISAEMAKKPMTDQEHWEDEFHNHIKTLRQYIKAQDEYDKALEPRSVDVDELKASLSRQALDDLKLHGNEELFDIVEMIKNVTIDYLNERGLIGSLPEGYVLVKECDHYLRLPSAKTQPSVMTYKNAYLALKATKESEG